MRNRFGGEDVELRLGLVKLGGFRTDGRTEDSSVSSSCARVQDL